VIATYGSYSHDDNEVVPVSLSKQVTYDENGVRIGYRHAITIRGVKQAASQGALTTALQALENAYSFNGYNWILRDNSGSPTVHTLMTSGSRTGVKVMGFRYLNDTGAEYTTYRTYEVDLEAEYVTSSPAFVTYEETLTFEGGGTQWVYLPTLYGPPQRQIARQQTPYRCVQAGSAVGFSNWPVLPVPLFPSLEHEDMRRLSKTTPQFLPDGNQRFPITWEYHFESAIPFFGNPTLI
jgi:hypothetical protein